MNWKICRALLSGLLLAVPSLSSPKLVSASETEVAAAEKTFEQTLKKIEEDYEAKVKAAEAEAIAKRKTAAAPLVAKLKSEEAAATKKGDLDAALKWREQIKAIQDGEKIQPPVGKQKLLGSLFASAEDAYIIYINGNRILEGGRSVTTAQVKLKVGDIITVRATGGSYGSGFACIMIFPEAKLQVVTNTSTWKSLCQRIFSNGMRRMASQELRMLSSEGTQSLTRKWKKSSPATSKRFGGPIKCLT